MRQTIVLALLLISGCSSSLTAIPREGSGGPYKGVATGSGSGDFSLEIDGTLYAGQWSWAGSGSLGLLNTYDTTTPTTGFSAGASASPGLAIASSPDGERLRCEFIFSEWTGTGFGVCKDSADRQHDLFIE